jgi:hypothetical protein
MATIKHHRSDTNVVQFRGRGVRAQLREALEARAPIRVLREKIAPNWVHGHIIGLSAEFCLIAEVSDSMRFDGFLAIAVGDVTAIEEDPGREFVERALALNEETIPVLPEIRLDDWETIAETAAAITPLISLNMLDGKPAKSAMSAVSSATNTTRSCCRKSIRTRSGIPTPAPMNSRASAPLASAQRTC